MPADPMAKMPPPQVPEQPVDLISDDEMRRLLTSVKGKDYVSRRDHAIFMLLADTGMRLGELAHLKVDGIDLDLQVAHVLSKGRRPRAVPFGTEAAAALDRYLRVRARHRQADDPRLWLRENGRGPMTSNGIGQMIRRRGREVGINGLHAHRFRHSFAHSWLSAGGNEHDLMRVAGWPRARCSLGTEPPPTSVRAMPTAACRLGIDCDPHCAQVVTSSRKTSSMTRVSYAISVPPASEH